MHVTADSAIFFIVIALIIGSKPQQQLGFFCLDLSSATRHTGRNDCKRDALACLAEALERIFRR